MKRSQEWEEAHSEFFQETYPIDRESITSDLHTCLPSMENSKNERKYSVLGVGTFTGCKPGIRTNRTKKRAAIQGLTQDDSDTDIEVLDFTDENLSTEGEAWKGIQKIKYMPIPLSQKKSIASQYQKCPKIKMKRSLHLKFTVCKNLSSIRSFIVGFFIYISDIFMGHSSSLARSHGMEIAVSLGLCKRSIFYHFFISLISMIFILIPFHFFSSPPNHPIYKSFDNISSGEDSDVLEDLLILVTETRDILNQSWLLYGYYSSDTETIIPWNLFPYKINSAYLIMEPTLCLVLSLLIVLLVGNLVKKDSRRSRPDSWFKTTIGLWNYGSDSGPEDYHRKFRLYKHLKFLLSKNITINRSKAILKYTFFRSISLLLTLGLWIFSMESTKFGTFNFPVLLHSILPAFFGVFVPTFFQLLGRIDGVLPHVRNCLYMGRLLIFRFIGLYTLFHRTSNLVESCIENEIGIQLIMIIIYETLFKTTKLFLLDLTRAGLYRFCCSEKRLPGGAEVDPIPILTDSIFDVLLCTLGLWYSPFFPILCFLKSVWVYGVDCLKTRAGSRIKSRILSPVDIKSMFILYLFLCFLLAVLTLMYIWSFNIPSNTCGPFKNTEDAIGTLITERIPLRVKYIYAFCTRAEILSAVILFLSVSLYVFRVNWKRSQQTARDLKSQLICQGQDKKYLMSRITYIMAKSSKTDKYSTK